MVFFDFYGNCIGRFLPMVQKTGKVFVEQAMAYHNESQKAYLQKQIQQSAMLNMLAVLKYYEKKGRKVEIIIAQIERYKKEMISKEAKSFLLWEAKVKKTYYKSFDILLAGTDFRFEIRSKHPPRNEINAMMSYGYSLLYATFLTIIDCSRLVPEISFIHSIEKSGPSLQYDLADIFKPVIIDRLILKLIRKKQIKLHHFDFYQDGRCYFNKEGISIFVEAYHDFLKSKIQYKGRSISYHSLLKREVNQLANYILNQDAKYEPFTMKW